MAFRHCQNNVHSPPPPHLLSLCPIPCVMTVYYYRSGLQSTVIMAQTCWQNGFYWHTKVCNVLTSTTFFFGRVWPWRNQRGHLHYAPMLGSGGCGLLCLHLRSRPCMYQKFCIIFVLNTSFVSCTSRPQLCIPDDRWHTVERELHSSLLWIRAERCWHLLQDGQVLTQYSVPSLSSAWKVLLV